MLQADENLAFGATPDHIFAENTVKEVAVRSINGTFQDCDHGRYCISVPSCVPLKKNWRLWQRTARLRFCLLPHDSYLKMTRCKALWNVHCTMRLPTSSIAR